MDFINKAETDTAFEGFHRRKQEAASLKSSNCAPSTTKRSLDADSDQRLKRMRTGSSNGLGTLDVVGKEAPDHNPFNSILPLPLTSTSPSDNYLPSARRATHDTGLFTELLQGQTAGSSLYPPNSTPDGSSSYMAGSSSNTPTYASYQQPVNLHVQSAVRSDPYMSNNSISMHPTSSAPEDEEWPEEPKLQEAARLIR